ncbi:MAG TPA: hypothetical protein VI383_04960 [Gemmatimonadales bacterium]|nr:hypothetical protein [Gemmatimonadales bacterium]
MGTSFRAAGRLGLVALPLLFTASPPLPPPQAAVRPVVITVTCAGPGVNFSLTPWRVGLSAANPVEWRLNAAANTDEITIEPAPGQAWPFQEAPPFRATKGAAKRAGALRPGLPSGTVYRYTVTLECRAAGSGPFRVVIDPDMVVD